MKTIGAYEAKTNLSRILEEVREGETYAITKHGVTVALLQPADRKPQPVAVIDAIRELRKKKRLGKNLDVTQIIREGRRR